MNIEEVEKEKMAALETLAKTNMEIGKARGAFAAIKGDETAYLKERETRATSLVGKVLEESREAIKKAFSNYAKIKELLQMASSFASYITSASEQFHALYETFTELVGEWEKKVKKQQEDIAEVRLSLVEQEKAIEKDKKTLEKARKQLEIDKLRVKDDTERLSRAVARLKNNRV